MATKDGRVQPHRLMVAQKLGRCLKIAEVVHHIDGDCENNKIENLALFNSNSEHISFHRVGKPSPIWNH